ncbi:uncharacterized protein CXQ87_001631 [Candidozyma duobushaemuli]|uniref:Uncharacterized protein n=2 Tax=Candidozyma TaxID=3303203 RepID=A0ABX8I4M4_9ASCO|nr:uncharacterized protein CXQ87_001631 [[Candida] duobushaemulonis]PVH13526.1 hypothetical protein CXQ87_001631 [[Candida] duobushaemulonis]QWU88230.1 hypothetical protein CA3LBN_002495 [[Candida] haemuloni]
MIRGFRSVAARRLVSTANAPTKFTTLASGVTVATETNPNAPSSTVGVYFAGGSRAETPYNNGVGALTTRTLAQGLDQGVLLSATNTKEANAFVAQTTNANVNAAASALSKLVVNREELIEKADFTRAKAALRADIDALEANPSEMVLEHLDASAFQGYSLGLPTLGTNDSVPDIEKTDSLRFLDKHLVGSNTVIAASGNFDHDALVETLDKEFKLQDGPKPTRAPASFLGSEVRMRDDTIPKAYISIAAQGEGLSSPAYFVAKVGAAVFGSFDQDKATAKFTSPKLASIVQDYHIVDKYTHFSRSYSDTGLWGFNAEISNLGQVDDFVHFALKQWNRLSVSVTDAEIARAKAQVKTELLATLNSPTSVVHDIASKVLLNGYRASISQSLEAIDAISNSDVRAWASAALWDKDIVISGTGSIEALLDYNRARNDMAMMRF